MAANSGGNGPRMSGAGGNSFLGGGAPAVALDGHAHGVDAVANSGGGGSGAISDEHDASSRNGGAGGSGIVVIEEYA